MKKITKIHMQILSAMLSFLLIFMLFATVSVLPASAVEGETNIVTNGDFDSDASGWTVWDHTCQSGQVLLKDWAQCYQTVTVESNTKYFWKIRVAGNVTASSSFTFSLGFLESFCQFP